MRLPYVPNPPEYTEESDKEVLKRVQARRGERGLIALDLSLLHSPPIADGWNAFLGAIRTRSSLPEDIKEIAISRVAVLNGAEYEWAAHAPLMEKAGVKKEAVTLVKEAKPGVKDGDSEIEKGLLSAKQWAVLRYSDAMTKDVVVSDAIFATLKEYFSEREVVEITATVAAYNCVSRFLVALDVGEMAEKGKVDVKV